MGKLEGKVAFITGAARGKGRSHAIRLAQEGADIIAVNICEDIPGIPYAAATEENLAETAKQVESLDRRIIATKADVRDYKALKDALDDGVAQLAGKLDIVVGLMRALALELGRHNIRVNSIHPTQVDTPMIQNEPTWQLFRPDLEHPTREDFVPASQAMNVLPIPWVEPVDISNAVLFLASDEGRYLTGVALPVDAGTTVK